MTAIIIWPIVCITEPIILTPTIDNLVNFLNIYINSKLKSAPNKEKKKVILNTPVLRIPTKKTRKIDIINASFKEKV